MDTPISIVWLSFGTLSAALITATLRAMGRAARRGKHQTETLAAALRSAYDDDRLSQRDALRLAGQGWRSEDVQALEQIPLAHRDRSEALVPWIASLAHDPRVLPGTTPRQHIAWLAALLSPVPCDLMRGIDGGKSSDDRINYLSIKGASARLYDWSAAVGPDLAPFAFAAGLTPDEARAQAQAGTLTVEGLLALAALRGTAMPAVPAHRRAR